MRKDEIIHHNNQLQQRRGTKENPRICFWLSDFSKAHVLWLKTGKC